MRLSGVRLAAGRVPASYEFSERVFDLDKMRERLPGRVFDQYKESLGKGFNLSAGSADVIATALKDWAVTMGVSHYSHQYQPIIGGSAEKHEAFLDIGQSPSGNRPIAAFSGKRMLFGETDASSFPSGGLRAAHASRGYSVWDTSAFPYVIDVLGDPVLVIPSLFYSWAGHSLDNKIPLLRSEECLKSSTLKLFSVCGLRKHDDIASHAGFEQEFFLLSREHFMNRPDLRLTGRMLQGVSEPIEQRWSGSYSIPERVLRCLNEMEQEAWRVGIPVSTRHHEVSPNQFELACMFEQSGKAGDHNELLVSIMMAVARKHDMACALHEKPFQRLQGSGKHNNWSVGSNVSKSFFDPGRSPSENIEYLLALAAIMRGCDLHPELLRWSVSGAGNDLRLGGGEAPPAIMSIFAGSVMSGVIDSIASNQSQQGSRVRRIDLGLPQLPVIVPDVSDRNRSAPFALTGTRFEVRTPGSSQSAMLSTTVLNALLSDSFSFMERQVRTKVANGSSPNEAAMLVIQEMFKKHRRIIYDGDNYSDEWLSLAKSRGLPNYRTTPDVLDAVSTMKKSSAALASQHVLMPEEFNARCITGYNTYWHKITSEARVLSSMTLQQIIPAAARSHNILSSVQPVNGNSGGVGRTAGALAALMDESLELNEKLHDTLAELSRMEGPQNRARAAVDGVLPAMDKLRSRLDRLEERVEKREWPFPDSGDVLFWKH